MFHVEYFDLKRKKKKHRTNIEETRIILINIQPQQHIESFWPDMREYKMANHLWKCGTFTFLPSDTFVRHCCRRRCTQVINRIVRQASNKLVKPRDHLLCLCERNNYFFYIFLERKKKRNRKQKNR